MDHEKREGSPPREEVIDINYVDNIEASAVNEKALIRQVDWRLLPILGGLYAIALIDRVNISNARVAGMNKELELHIGSRYTIALLVFFIPYFIFELPSNIVLRKVGSANWLAFVAFGWGSFMLGQEQKQRLILKFSIGFFPGCVYLISCWYIRYEMQTRFVDLVFHPENLGNQHKYLLSARLAAFYLFSVLVGGFSAILAYGLMQMQGLRGYLGWRWIFIIEGLLTQVVAIISWFLIIDFPDKAQKTGFLTEREAVFIENRIEKDRADAVNDPLTWAKCGEHLKDLKLWAFAFMFMSTTTPAYAFAYSSPTIIQRRNRESPFCTSCYFAVISAYSFALVGDKYRLRGPIIAAQCIISIVGLMITAYHAKPGVRCFGIFLGTAGCQGNVPAILAYQSNNIRMQSKRSVGSALQIGFGAIGGIIASTTFREVDAPKYIPGLWTTAGLQFLILTLLACTTIHFLRRNKQVDTGTAMKPIEGLEGFKYTL
ncbi:conserved hypothetical protein [Histoplasma capsulatum var. duboisii H88]|uniref:Phthalate transporter n=2 Tax=Ajellomyces capsulatus TaxID=5037 RepID=F0UCA5_AJEC8|nr:conserved hypothetical protein [Histoplasma capsulatum H143]EGC43205.1 conserved hypothetical protein [Histoplasma capsulatum var. duboisii H88]